MPANKRNARPTAPAEGERAAIGGYAAQYRDSAYLILHALQEQTIECVRLADPAAGRVDDFQLERSGQLDAYQFKWSRYRGKFSLSDLQTKDGTNPPLIQQLSDGWKRLRSRFPTYKTFDISHHSTKREMCRWVYSFIYLVLSYFLRLFYLIHLWQWIAWADRRFLVCNQEKWMDRTHAPPSFFVATCRALHHNILRSCVRKN